MKDIVLTHYSAIPLGELERQGVCDSRPQFKPRGLWVGVGESWKEWCEAESFNLKGFKYKYLVEVLDWVDVLVLDTEAKMHEFNREYKIGERHSTACINWNRVVDKYKGILITPYHWSLHLHDQFLWYYCWDCASGCFWDPSIIKPTLCVKEKA